MNPTSTPSIATQRPGGHALLAAWLACGVLDITAACLNSWAQAGRSPLWLLQAVASALLGAASFSHGLVSAALGLALHFFVAFNAAAVFWLLCRRFPRLLRQAVAAGLLHGAAVYLFMNFVTLPFASWFRSLYLHTPVGYQFKPENLAQVAKAQQHAGPSALWGFQTSHKSHTVGVGFRVPVR